MKGKFIVFDGADCLGKSHQIDKVYSHLKEKGYKVIKTREPGGTNMGSKIRDIILDSKEEIPKVSELLLFFVDRNIHYKNLILPYLEKGYTILCDRYILSTLVYQGKLKGFDEDLILGLHEFSTGDLWPDLTFVFNGKRLNNDHRDLYEQRIEGKQELINNHYLSYLYFPNHIAINANRSEEEVFNEIMEYLQEEK